MSSILFNALSLENEEVETEEESPVQAELELEQAAGEIAEATSDVEQAELEQEELEAAEETMEGLVASLESALADETGMSVREAQAYRLAYRAAVGQALPNPIVSLESETGDTERLQASEISLEGIKETAKKIWEAIKRAVSNAIRAVADFFAKIFGGAKKLKEKLEAIKKEIGEATKDGRKLKDGKLETTTGLSGLFYGGSTAAANLEKGAKAVQMIAGTVYQLEGTVEATYKSLADAIRNREENESDVEKLVSSGPYYKAIEKNTKSIILPGDKMLAHSTDSDTEGRTKTGAVSSSSFGKFRIVNTPKVTAPKDMAVGDITLKELESLVDIALELIENVVKSKDRKDKIKKAREEVIKAGEDLQKDADKLSEKASNFWTSAKISARLRMANIDISSQFARVDSYVFSYARSVAAFAGTAVKEFKKAA